MDRKRSGVAGRRCKEQGHACRAQAGDQCFVAGPTASMETGFTKGATKGPKLGPAPSEAGTLRKAPRKLSLSFRNAPSMGETPPELPAICVLRQAGRCMEGMVGPLRHRGRALGS